MKKLEIGTATLYCGDCLEILPNIEKVNGCFTDPPYMINTKSDGNGKLSPWADYVNSAYWYGAWIGAVRDRLKSRGSLWTCLNWRSLVTFQKAACDLRWSIESLMVWDKGWIAAGGGNGLRPSYEMVAIFAMPDFIIENRSLADVQKFKWSSTKPHGHPAEKPEELMAFMVEHGTKEGDTVLDPFMGSGTTGVAAVRAGRRFIGIEQDEIWFDVAAERIEAEMAQTTLFG